MQHRFLVHSEVDHVGVAVTDISSGERVQGLFRDHGAVIDVEAREAVPFGHKIAIRELAIGATVCEYGVPIGRATAPIEIGTHVHTHNLRSARW